MRKLLVLICSVVLLTACGGSSKTDKANPLDNPANSLGVSGLSGEWSYTVGDVASNYAKMTMLLDPDRGIATLTVLCVLNGSQDSASQSGQMSVTANQITLSGFQAFAAGQCQIDSANGTVEYVVTSDKLSIDDGEEKIVLDRVRN